MRHRCARVGQDVLRPAVVAASLVLLAIGVGRVEAVSVPIQNPSFELPTIPGPPDNTWIDGIPTDWSVSPDGLATFVELNSSVGFSGGDGPQHAGIQGGAGYLYQDLGVPFAPFTRYTIDIASAHRSGFNHATLNFGLFSSDALGTDVGTPGFADVQGIWSGTSNPDADDQFNQLRDASLLQTIGSGALGNVYSYTTGAVPPTGNLVVFIRHQGDGSRVTFDNIRLDATLIPEPATLLLVASCGLALVGMRRRRILM